MSHELDSFLILIHPPLAILGYIFTFIAFKKIVDIVIRKKGSNVTEKDPAQESQPLSEIRSSW